MTVWFLFACGSPTPEERPPQRPRHASEWDALLAAADRADLATVRVLARDFSMGDVAEDHPAAGELGAALGFLQLAEDAEDVALGVERANAACASCHADRRPHP